MTIFSFLGFCLFEVEGRKTHYDAKLTPRFAHSVSALVWDLDRLSFTTSSGYWSECAERDLNPHERYCSHGLKPCASANFAIRASMEADGFEPSNPKERIYSPPQLTALLCFLILTMRDTLFEWCSGLPRLEIHALFIHRRGIEPLLQA